MIGIFARHERSFGPIPAERTVPKARAVTGVTFICIGLGCTAGITGLRIWVVAAPFVGAALLGFGPVYDFITRSRDKAA